MDLSIAALLAQDGITNGAIYALLALALVMVFAVTRVILVPAGEFLTIGTLTLAAFDQGRVPGTVHLVAGAAVLAGVVEAWPCMRRRAWLKAARGAGAVDRLAARARGARGLDGPAAFPARSPRWRWRSC